jgi:hypothetical protein
MNTFDLNRYFSLSELESIELRLAGPFPRIGLGEPTARAAGGDPLEGALGELAEP